MRLLQSSRIRSWLALMLVSVMAVMMAVPAMAAPPVQLTLAQKIQLLQQYRIVRGDEQGNLLLDRPIKRAELIAIVVRAMGKDAVAETYKGMGLFPDSKGHWADGYLSYGRTVNLVKGNGDGLARPEDYVTYAEAMTLVLRLVNQEPTAGDWPTNILLKALDLGVQPAGVDFRMMSQPGIRSDIFGAMADALVKVKNAEGKTYFEAFLNPATPAISLDTLPVQTGESTVRISGRATGAVAVTVNGVQAAMTGDSFTASITLNPGANTITVTASDAVGVTSTKQATISRTVPYTRLEIEGPSTVGIGQKAKYTITAYNADDEAVPAVGVTAKVEGNIGTFDLATGTLTASQSTGAGRIVLTAGSVTTSIAVTVGSTSEKTTQLGFSSDLAAVSYTKPMTVKVEARDADGNLVTEEFGRTVTLTAFGATVTPATATMNRGVATFTVKGTQPGAVNLTATSTGIDSVEQSVDFTTTTYVALIAEDTTLPIGGVKSFTRIRAELRNESGTAIANKTGEDIQIELSETGSDGELYDSFLTIRRDTTNSVTSGDSGEYGLGTKAGTVTISGRIVSGQNYSVGSAYISVTKPTAASGAKFVVVSPNKKPAPGETGTFLVRVEDAQGNTVDGDYAFQVSVKTSNNESAEELANSLTVELGDSGETPLSDGKAEGSTDDGADVIARTSFGTAAINVTYDKPGLVTLTVTGAAATNEAYDDAGDIDKALSGGGLATGSDDGIWYEVPTRVVLKADSEGFGKDQAVAAGSTSRNRSMTIRAYFTNDDGYWVPGTTGDIQLEHTGTSTRYSGTTMKSSVADGKAEFTISSTSKVGQDTYSVVAANVKLSKSETTEIDGDPLTVQIDSAAPDGNPVLWARGYKGDEGRSDFSVAPDDDGLELELTQDTTQQWVVVKFLYGSTTLYTSEPIDISAAQPKVHVPKSVLKSGTYSYKVIVRNGYGDSPATTTSDITNGGYSTAMTISGARYDAAHDLLYIQGSGFTNGTTANPTGGAMIDPSLLTIEDPLNIDGGKSTIDLSGAALIKSTSSQLTLDVRGVSGGLSDLTQFSGTDVKLVAVKGWYVGANGQIASADSTGNSVSPLAYIAYGAYDRTNKRLTVYGAGFNGSTVAWDKVTINTSTGVKKLSSYGNSKVNDSQWYFTISEDVTTSDIMTSDGWSKTGSGTTAILQPAVDAAPIYTQVRVSYVTYSNGTLTIKGTGFAGGTVAPSLVRIKDVSSEAEIQLSANPTVTDTAITFTLTSGQLSAYAESDLETGFKGSDIYVIADAGWFTNASGEGAPILAPQLRMPTK